MRIRWSPGAAAALYRIVEYIRADNLSAARRVGRAIYERPNLLIVNPYAGREGRVEGTRELALAPLPYFVVYRILEQAGVVEIVNVIHGAQRWPPGD